jgi:ATP-dependent helicase/nuclease subunit A
MIVPNDASSFQVRAADPGLSTWLSANAGSGKTRVLTDRVARLLLQEVSPQRILCLTYTKAAATEMQNRLFRRLGVWAMMPDADLRQALADLGEDRILGADVLARARQLFARAIDTPGGLRIQTIHSFCAMLLRRFPLEAGVSPQFTEMDDRAAQLLQEDVLEEMSDGADADSVRRLAGFVPEGTFPDLIKQIVANRAAFGQRWTPADLLAAFDLPPDFDEESLLAEVFLGGEADLVGALISALLTGNPKSEALKNLPGKKFDMPGQLELKTLEKAFLVASDSKKTDVKAGSARIGVFPPSATAKLISHQMPQIEDLMRRVEAARPRRLALKAAQRTAILHDFAQVFLARYQAKKDARGWLDFDDLIQRVRRLLTEPGLAAWVLYRLDGGIDHILVDEAQDTSPDQWQVIQSLTDEFFAGENAARIDRTLFVVGDKKQSIYSFQGADLLAFDRMRDHFAARIAGTNQSLVRGELRHSFRSSSNILRLVDLVFQGDARDAIGGEIAHLPFHLDQPGRVDLWPLIPSAAKPEDTDPYDPVDILGEGSAEVTLATRIANAIKDMLAAGTQIRIDGKDRPIHAGDILILVRRRSPLFAEIIRACKKADLPIAGADRLKLGAEVAVKDLAALLSFLATPEDDLSLATVLRSPLCGLSESQLYALAQPRKGYLWQALRGAEDRHSAVVAMLGDLRAQADFLRPYELIERVLTRHDGRRRLLARLGPEAEDGIDELLQQALSHERRDVPSLTSFLVALQTDDVEVKRQSDSAGRRIRVMTVHGAKGLEAPVVILPDTADYDPPDRDQIVRPSEGPVFARSAADELPHRFAQVIAQRKARQAEERLRLLYVAMTRAQSWLIVAVAGKLQKSGSWYQLIAAAVEVLGPTEILVDGIRRHSFGDWPVNVEGPASPDDHYQAVPDWALRPAPEPWRAPALVSPSDLGGAKVLPEEVVADGEDARQRGRLLHVLLEHLAHVPVSDRPIAAEILVPDGTLRQDLLVSVNAILDNPAFTEVFGPDSLAEVPVTAELAGRRLFGTIDRLIVRPDHVLAIDFKSNRLVPQGATEVPEGILRQMGAYAEALGQIYPGRLIETAILWTARPTLMVLDRDIVRQAVQRATIP